MKKNANQLGRLRSILSWLTSVIGVGLLVALFISAPAEAADPTATPEKAASTAAPKSTPRAPTATPQPLPPIPPLNPNGHVGLGAYLDGTPYDSFKAVELFEHLVIDHRLTYALWFQAWGDDDKEFPTYWIQLAAKKNLIPVITWEPWKRDFKNPTAVQPDFLLSRIAAGDHDEYIHAWAEAAHDVGVPFILRYAHEQSTQPGTRPWYPWQGEPEHFKSSFRHIVDIFRQEGANNVQFYWSAMWLNQWGDLYYPGDDVVDWIGTTVLNHGTGSTASWAAWRTFDDLFQGQYEAALKRNKPIMISELATAEQGGDKAAWLTDLLISLSTKYPLVEGILLFEVTSDREWPAIDWSVASSLASLDAFKKGISTPYFK